MTKYQSGQTIRIATSDGKGFFYGRPTDATFGMAKFGVDAQTNEIVEIGRIPTLTFVQTVIIVNETTGYFSLGEGEYKIGKFNPQTMEQTGSIDLSGAFDFPKTEDGFRSYYSTMMYNEVTKKILISIYIDNSNTPQFYDTNEVHVTIIDEASGAVEKTITHTNAQYPITRGRVSSIVDTQGNTYFIAQGSYGIDGNIGAAAPVASRPQIIKINTSSEFEENYAFNPVNALGFQNNFFQLFTTITYVGNGKAYGLVTAIDDTTQPELLGLLQKLGAGTITQAEYDQLVFLVLYTPTQKWVEIDLTSKNVREVSGIPFTAGFSYPFASQGTSNNLFVQFVNQTQSGYYEINTATNSASELFTLSAGGTVEAFIDLSAKTK